FLLGSTEANAARYGVHNGGAWTRASYEKYLVTGNQADLVTANVSYIEPERLRAFEIGYKGLFGTDFLFDINYYHNSYENFIGSLDIASKEATEHQGNPLPAGTIFSPYVNSAATVSSSGIGIGLTYNLPYNLQLSGNYNRATFEENKNEDENFRAGFNTPENKFSIGLSSRKLAKNLGFNVNFRWQEEFLWQSDFGNWVVPEFGVFDAQLNYKVQSIKTMVKIGGTNIGGGDYRTNFGGPFVGQQYYISLTFDQFMK